MSKIYLRGVTVDACETSAYPLNSPQIVGAKLLFTTPVTLFAGENGSGKSTLLEAIACEMNLPAVGASDLASDHSLAALMPLRRRMKLTYSVRTHRGFFLRAEDFFGYVHRINLLRAEMYDELHRVDREYAGHSAFTRNQARMAFSSSAHQIEERFGDNADAFSHGESFINLFQSRIHSPGIYLLDEPEAPLSPVRLLALMSLIKEREEDSQFIIATHSPMLLAYPGATIYSFDETPIASTKYDDLESVKILRSFIQSPERYLRYI